ncbi:MAG: hypothetical protein HRT54_02775 [Colwellia sp.]|nr:hypothetical protein [Colwellia sp.]
MRKSLKPANFFFSIVMSAVVLLVTLTTHARDLEITPFIGQMSSSDLMSNQDNGIDLAVDGANNYGLAIAWQDSPKGQGQILFNTVRHNFISTSDLQEHSFDVTYLHFSGVAQFKQRYYVTTVSLGVGGTYFDTDNKEEIYPSLTVAFGTRYELSKTFAIVTELRGYASYIEEDNQLFCEGTTCHALLEKSMWLEGSISVGFAVKF